MDNDGVWERARHGKMIKVSQGFLCEVADGNYSEILPQLSIETSAR